jgi:hypothetical protein
MGGFDMDKKKAYKLADALESGKYKQTTEYLSKDGAYCCLGVACKINKIPGYRTSQDQHSVVLEFKGSTGQLTLQAQKLTGIHSTGGDFVKPIQVKRRNGISTRYPSLATMNDQSLSFKFIAKILRKHYKNIK